MVSNGHTYIWLNKKSSGILRTSSLHLWMTTLNLSGDHFFKGVQLDFGRFLLDHKSDLFYIGLICTYVSKGYHHYFNVISMENGARFAAAIFQEVAR